MDSVVDLTVPPLDVAARLYRSTSGDEPCYVPARRRLGHRRLQHPPPAPVARHGVTGRPVRPPHQEEREALPLRLPPALRTIPAPAASQPQTATEPEPDPLPRLPLVTPGAVEFDRVVPASGNVFVEGRQFWLGPARAGSHHVLGRPRCDPPARRWCPHQVGSLASVHRRHRPPRRHRWPSRRPTTTATRRQPGRRGRG
jgi:hypothetical protein